MPRETPAGSALLLFGAAYAMGSMLTLLLPHEPKGAALVDTTCDHAAGEGSAVLGESSGDKGSESDNDEDSEETRLVGSGGLAVYAAVSGIDRHHKDVDGRRGTKGFAEQARGRAGTRTGGAAQNYAPLNESGDE